MTFHLKLIFYSSFKSKIKMGAFSRHWSPTQVAPCPVRPGQTPLTITHVASESPAAGAIHTHQSILHSCSWAFQAATLGSNPAYKHTSSESTARLHQECRCCLGDSPWASDPSNQRRQHYRGPAMLHKSHSQDQEAELVYPICREKPKLDKMKKQRNMFQTK